MKTLQTRFGFGALVGWLSATVALGWGATIFAQDAILETTAVQQATRIALAQGVAKLKQRAADDPDGWIIGPGRFRKVIGYTNIVIHYRRTVVEHPVYEYSNVVTFIPGSVGEPPRKVVQSRPVRQIGTKKVEDNVIDKDGPIAVERRYPQYDPGGNVQWYANSLGDEALAIHALRHAGVSDSDAVMQRALDNVRGHLEVVGVPDHTWDLAWLTALFAEVPGPEADVLTQRLASRLLDGQITDGAARGLWGPICVHPGVLAVMLRDYLTLFADVQKKEAKLKAKYSKTGQAAVDEARQALDRQREQVEAVCKRGLRFGYAELTWILDPNVDPQVMIAGAGHFFYNQTAADLDSTWAALHALSVAAAQKRLPVETLRPRFARPAGGGTVAGTVAIGTGMPQPEKAEAVLARAANAITDRQNKDGRWDECNVHQPVTKFDAFSATLPVPADPKSFPPLSSPVTPVSVVQGLMALRSIGDIIGQERLPVTVRNACVAGTVSAQKEIDAQLAALWPKHALRPRLTKITDYTLLLTLATPGGKGGAVAFQEPGDLLELLVLAGNPDGSWSRGSGGLATPTSSRARLEVLKTIPSRVYAKDHDPIEMNKAHMWQYNGSIWRDGEGYATAVAVLYLANRVENPAVALEEYASSPELAELRKTADKDLLDSHVVKPVPKPTPPPPKVEPVPPPAPPPAPEPGAEADKDIPVIPVGPADEAPKKDEAF